jgi:hypothetical protein
MGINTSAFPFHIVVALLYNAICFILICQNATRSIEIIAADKKHSDALSFLSLTFFFHFLIDDMAHCLYLYNIYTSDHAVSCVGNFIMYGSFYTI